MVAQHTKRAVKAAFLQPHASPGHQASRQQLRQQHLEQATHHNQPHPFAMSAHADTCMYVVIPSQPTLAGGHVLGQLGCMQQHGRHLPCCPVLLHDSGAPHKPHHRGGSMTCSLLGMRPMPYTPAHVLHHPCFISSNDCRHAVSLQTIKQRAFICPAWYCTAVQEQHKPLFTHVQLSSYTYIAPPLRTSSQYVYTHTHPKAPIQLGALHHTTMHSEIFPPADVQARCPSNPHSPFSAQIYQPWVHQQLQKARNSSWTCQTQDELTS